LHSRVRRTLEISFEAFSRYATARRMSRRSRLKAAPLGNASVTYRILRSFLTVPCHVRCVTGVPSLQALQRQTTRHRRLQPEHTAPAFTSLLQKLQNSIFDSSSCAPTMDSAWPLNTHHSLQ
jgi:hypothetical protein